MADEKTLRKGELGYYDSPLPDYPGYIRLPHPFTGQFYKAWWRAATPVETVPPKDIENLDLFKQWRGAQAIVWEWKLEGLAPGQIDASADQVPLSVLVWLDTVVAAYIADHLSLKKLPAPSTPTL